MINDLRGFYEANGMDYDSVLSRFGNNEQRLQKFLTQFPSDSAYSELEKAVKVQDYENALMKATVLKAIAYNLGMIELGKCSYDIFFSIRNGNIEVVSELFTKLQHEYERIITALNT